MDNNFYEEFIFNNLRRLLTQIDRDSDSPTFGSCDRNYWHYKIRDFSSAILQQSALTLTIINNLNFSGNVYYKNTKINKLIYGIIHFWSKIQLKDGSFNEYYPNEHAFPPTAFSLFAISETYRRLELENNDFLKSMEKAAIYLSKNFELKACNQEMASITALYSYYLNTNQKWILESINNKLIKILNSQSEEGWFPEYGGADLGYLSVSLDMLAEYYSLSNDERVLKPLENILYFISYFCHPDKTYGGEYGSRNTIYLLPNGLETMINCGNSLAYSIKKFIFSDDAHKNFFTSIDDRYLSHYIFHSFARALEKETIKRDQRTRMEKLPCQYDHFKVFPHSGLLTFKTENISGILSMKKGGLLRVFDKDIEVFSDFGYRYSYGKFIATTNWLDNSYEFKVKELNNIEISGSFNLIKQQMPNPSKHMILRFLSAIFGKTIIRILKKQLIFINRHSKTGFIRKIKISKENIKIEDKILFSGPIKNFHSSPVYSLRHVASGNFFYFSELADIRKITIPYVENPILIIQNIDLLNNKIDIKYEELQKSDSRCNK